VFFTNLTILSGAMNMNELNWKEISKRLKELRIKNKITIERLSEIIGVSTSFVGLVERGDSGISVDNLYKLSCVFAVTMDYLLTGESEGSVQTTPQKFSNLTTALADYSDKEIDFLIDMSKFLKSRVSIK